MAGALVVDVGSIADRMRKKGGGSASEDSGGDDASSAIQDDAVDQMIEALSSEKVDKGAFKSALKDFVKSCYDDEEAAEPADDKE